MNTNEAPVHHPEPIQQYPVGGTPLENPKRSDKAETNPYKIPGRE